MEIASWTKKGFTLIELLIVVAIIAILAAIAIPNFLEAQTRSKVSRTKSDMRTMNIGLESFRVDHNFYPPVNYDYMDFMHRLIPLTTPVAYLTALPEDVFALGLSGTSSDAMTEMLLMAYKVDDKLVHPFVFEYVRRESVLDDWTMYCANSNVRQWMLKSIGPSQVPNWFGLEFPSYDPSNGTISAGAIILAGPQ